MLGLLTPPRRRGEEILDNPGVAPEIVTRSLGDVAKVNALFGGVSAVIAELESAVPDLPSHATLLDLGTGVGDIPREAARVLLRRGIRLTTIGVDSARALGSVTRADEFICADALRLPVASRSADIVVCSQFLHHFLPEDAATLIREMNRVARIRVVISDLHRSWIAVAGLWAASFPLRFHPISRHDGMVSVMRGFTRTELQQIISRAIGTNVNATYRRAFRVTAGWTPVAE